MVLPGANSSPCCCHRWPRTGCRWSRRPGRRARTRRRSRWRWRVVLPGANFSPCCCHVGHVQVAAGVEGQGVGLGHAGGVGGAGAWCCPARTSPPYCCRCWPRTGCRWSRTPGRAGRTRRRSTWRWPWCPTIACPDHGRIAAGVDVHVGPAQRDRAGRRDRRAGVIVSVPTPLSPVSAAVRSAPSMIGPLPALIVPPEATTRFVRAVTSIVGLACRRDDVVKRQAAQAVQVDARRLDGRRADRNDLLGRVRVVGELDAVAARADRPGGQERHARAGGADLGRAVAGAMAVMPPVPAVMLIEPPLPFRAVPVPRRRPG